MGHQFNQYMQPMQNRLNQMEQQFPQFSQNYQMQYPAYSQTSILKGRPVSSYDEAKASMIDLDGSVFVFPDFGNKKIYTKQINLDGTATINTYNLDEELKSSPASVESPKSDDNVLSLVNSLQNQIDLLKDEINSLRKERSSGYAKSTHGNGSNDKHDAKSKSND